jgi:transglutaminase/protease-like cytokinesis protein 3
MKKYWLTLILVYICNTLFAQYDYTEVDKHAFKVGKLDSMNMGSITTIITKPFSIKKEKARAIYTWVANNITYDLKAIRRSTNDKDATADVLLYRKATSEGFAKLYQDMCSSAGIRCLTVDGYLKRNPLLIGEEADEKDHMWNVVQLDISPTEWFYVDAALASGYFDGDMKVVTKSFTTAYFFPNKKLFNWQHYPDNMAWRLEEGPKTKKEFFNLPVIDKMGVEYELKNFTPSLGTIKAKLNKPVNFSFTFAKANAINKVAIRYNFKKKSIVKDVDFLFDDTKLSFTYKFDKEDTLPFTILIDGKELISYLAIVEDED